MINNPIICAIDVHDFDEAVMLIDEVYKDIYAIKLGLEFYTEYGKQGIKKIIEKFPDIKIFLDLKFHDIPNTVAGAMKAIVDLENIVLTTIHASGGSEMIKRAVEIASANKNLKILSVTKLTSLEFNMDEILKLTEIALKAGSHGIVCPAAAVVKVREKFSKEFPNFLIVTPGIRPLGDAGKVENDDQNAISTPKGAMENGSDFLVIGRPITQAKDKKQAINDILESIYNE